MVAQLKNEIQHYKKIAADAMTVLKNVPRQSKEEEKKNDAHSIISNQRPNQSRWPHLGCFDVPEIS